MQHASAHPDANYQDLFREPDFAPGTEPAELPVDDFPTVPSRRYGGASRTSTGTPTRNRRRAA
ncbi:hypothetical protein [Actinophytocola oryzae]|uniref:hypothetical protein n=1 Tax=Actinophytocola oryzae TaxID=502181 RepID=UPI0010630F9C|nr:hypothetical protein [Actinophytocola oryzae]